MPDRQTPAAHTDAPSRPAAAESGRWPLHTRILIGLLIGAAAGLLINRFAVQADGTTHPVAAWLLRWIAQPLGQIFLRLIFMVVLPLVFCALSLGIAEIGDVRRLGRLGLRTLFFTLLLSSASVLIGVGLADLFKPGGSLAPEQQAALRARYAMEAQKQVQNARQAKSPIDLLLDVIPRNPLQEMVGALDGSSPGGGMLAVMFFSLMFGIALQLAPARAAPVIAVLEGVYDAMLALVGIAMRLAPYGVAGLMASMAAALGLDLLRTLGWYVVTVIVGLLLHGVGVYSLVLILFARRRPGEFFRAISEIIVTAFGTSSSNATLPTSLRVTEQKLGVSRRVTNFVLTIGSTANQNGTALYEGVTVLFLAQVFGVHLSLAQQFTVVLLAVLAGVGTAGVPGGSLPLVVLVLQSVGIPAEGIGVILGVDRLLDMCRTVVNVVGDVAVAACVDRTADSAETRGLPGTTA